MTENGEGPSGGNHLALRHNWPAQFVGMPKLPLRQVSRKTSFVMMKSRLLFPLPPPDAPPSVDWACEEPPDLKSPYLAASSPEPPSEPSEFLSALANQALHYSAEGISAAMAVIGTRVSKAVAAAILKNVILISPVGFKWEANVCFGFVTPQVRNGFIRVPFFYMAALETGTQWAG